MANLTLEEVMGQLSADERKLFDNTLQKYPDLKGGWTRESDYSKKTADLADKRKQLEAQEQVWKAWADKSIPVYNGLVEAGAIDEDGHYLWLQREEELKKELETTKAKILSGGDVDPAELDRLVTEKVSSIVKAAGGASKDEIAALISSETSKLMGSTFDDKYAEVKKKFDTETIPFVTGFATDMALAAQRYEKATGEEFTDEVKDEFLKFMGKEDNWKPTKAVTLFFEPQVSKKRIEKEIEDKAEERYKKIMAVRGGLPGSGDEPYIPVVGQGKGSLQRLMEDSKEGEGDMESAVMAAGRQSAAEFRAEGKF